MFFKKDNKAKSESLEDNANSVVDKYAASAKQIDKDEEAELRELAKFLKNKIENGEIKNLEQIELVNSYMRLVSPHMSSKQQLKLKVKLIKVNKPTLIVLITKAISMVDLDS